MTNFYVPDEWVVLKIDDDPLHYKILAGWKEAYLTGSSWRLNSGVVLAEKMGIGFCFMVIAVLSTVAMNETMAWGVQQGIFSTP